MTSADWRTPCGKSGFCFCSDACRADYDKLEAQIDREYSEAPPEEQEHWACFGHARHVGCDLHGRPFVWPIQADAAASPAPPPPLPKDRPTRPGPTLPSGRVVYFVGPPDPKKIKIGKASDVRSRLSGLQTGNHERLTVLATIPGYATEENALHARFAHLRDHGEWFRYEAELREYVEGLRA